MRWRHCPIRRPDANGSGGGTRPGDALAPLFADGGAVLAGPTAEPLPATLSAATGPLPVLLAVAPATVQGAPALVVTVRDLAEPATARIGRVVVAGDPPRLLTAAHLIDALRLGPGRLVADAERADAAALPALHRRSAAWLAALARVGLDAERAVVAGAQVADALLARGATLAHAGLAAPPAPCALLALGSHGRHELLPGGDPDSALVYADAAGAADMGWFLAFGQALTGLAHAAGWPRCPGGKHAGDARWCLPLAAWQARAAVGGTRGAR
jgi:hypothetical protein